MDANEPFLEKKKQESSQKILAVILMTITIILSITLVGLVLYLRVSTGSQEPQESFICVPSTSIDTTVIIGLDSDVIREHIDSSGQRMLCGKASDVLNLMVKKVVTEWDHAGDTGEDFMNLVGCTTEVLDKSTGFLRGIDFKAMNQDESGVVQWNTSSLKGDIGYKHGSFIIDKHGHYYITAQLMFGNTQSADKLSYNLPEESVNDLTLTLEVYKRSAELNEKILEGTKTLCDLPAELIEVTITVGAAFYLVGGDEVFVSTSTPYKLVAGDESNQFSIYNV